MTITAIIPMIVCIAGLLLWLIGPEKAKKIGEYMFFCGLLASCFAFANESWHIGSGPSSR